MKYDESSNLSLVWNTENVFNCYFAQVWVRVGFSAPVNRSQLLGSKTGTPWQNGAKRYPKEGRISGVRHQCPTLTTGSCPLLGICNWTAQVKRGVVICVLSCSVPVPQVVYVIGLHQQDHVQSATKLGWGSSKFWGRSISFTMNSKFSLTTLVHVVCYWPWPCATEHVF